MPRPRFDKAPPAKREAVLEAGAREFAKFGYEAASINRILDSAGLSKGAFYYYFDDKADLAAAVLFWAYREVFAKYDRIELPTNRAGFWRGVKRFMHESLAMLERLPYSNELITRMGQAMVNDRDLAARMVEAAAGPIAAMTAFWKRGQRLGAVRKDLSAEVLVGLLQGVKEALIRVMLPDGRTPTTAELQRLADLQFDLFRRVSVPGRLR